MKIFLNEKIPHPHADISTLSTYTDEMEVLILPFCPIKEIKRKKDTTPHKQRENKKSNQQHKINGYG